jgi:hypothetical protein
MRIPDMPETQAAASNNRIFEPSTNAKRTELEHLPAFPESENRPAGACSIDRHFPVGPKRF